MDGISTQPGENAGSRSEAGGSQSGFSGLHIPVRPELVRSASLPECDSIAEGPVKRTGSGAGHDRQPVFVQADTRSDSGAEPESARPGRLLQPRLSGQGLPDSQRLRAAALLASPSEPYSGPR